MTVGYVDKPKPQCSCLPCEFFAAFTSVLYQVYEKQDNAFQTQSSVQTRLGKTGWMSCYQVKLSHTALPALPGGGGTVCWVALLIRT